MKDSGKKYLSDHGPIWREVVRSIGGSDDVTCSIPKEMAKEIFKYFLICPENTVVKRYRAKPRKSFQNAFIPGRMKETLGKLRVVTALEYKKLVKA